MKTLLCTLILATCGTVAAKADSITVNFDQPNQVAVAGGTLEFFGTITNLTNTTIYLNADSLNMAGDFSTNDDFFTNVPISIDPGATSDDVELFDVIAGNPILDASGNYLGTYTLVGGADGGTDSAQDNLGTATFSVTVVPEPSTIYLLLGGLPAALLPITKKIRSRAR